MGKPGYALLSRELMEHIWPLLTDEERAVLPVLLTYLPNIRPKPETVSDRLKKSKRSVHRAIKRLRASELLIEIEPAILGRTAATYSLADLADDGVRSSIVQALSHHDELTTSDKYVAGVISGVASDMTPDQRQKCHKTSDKSGTYIRITREELQKKNHSPADRASHTSSADELFAGSAATSAGALPSVLRVAEFSIVWDEYRKHRREKKQPLTPTNEKKALKKLEGWGVLNAIASINQSIENGWTGLFDPPKNGASNGHGKTADYQPGSKPGPLVCKLGQPIGRRD